MNFNTVMTVMNRLVEKLHLEKTDCEKEVVYIVLYKQKEEFLSNQTKKNDTGIDGGIWRFSCKSYVR